MRRRITAALVCAGAAALAMPALAMGHVSVDPAEAPAEGFVVLDVRVPNEEDNASTTKVEVQFPDGFAEVSFQPVPGWNVKAKKTRLATPITTDEGDKLTEQVSQVTWSGGRIGPGEFQEFPVSVQIPNKPNTTLTFKAIQTYSDGKVVRWIGPPDAEEPAPQVKITEAAPESAAATPAASTAESSDDDDSNALPIVALILGAIGALAGGTALVRGRRA
jgi:uncharacterized protein YcnI